MEILIELLLSLLVEFVLPLFAQLMGELLSQLGRRAWVHLAPWSVWLAVPAYAAAGMALGWISVWALPSALLPHGPWRVANLVLSPIAAGGLAMLLGMWRRRRGQPTVRLDHFAYAFLLALGFAAVRYARAD